MAIIEHKRSCLLKNSELTICQSRLIKVNSFIGHQLKRLYLHYGKKSVPEEKDAYRIADGCQSAFTFGICRLLAGNTI